MATGVYKAIHGYKVPRGIGELLHERSTNYNLRGKHILELPKVNTTTYGLKSWRYTAAKIWNALPDQFCATNKIGTFKNLMSKLDFSNFTLVLIIFNCHIYFYIGFYEKSSLSIIISSLFIYFSWHVCKVAN